jgi:hypothetical protein
MNNITYIINETEKSDSDDDSNTWEEIPLSGKRSKHETDETRDMKTVIIDVNERSARELDYDLNYNFKYLTNILEFYGKKKGKLNKSEIIEKIVDFETNLNNGPIVDDRKRLFNNIIELKNDKYFSKFILSNFN